MEFELKYQCHECEGFGKIEHQRSETLFSVSPCPECGGEAFITVQETYDSIQDLRADYPDAKVEEVSSECKSNGHRDTGRGVCADCGEFL